MHLGSGPEVKLQRSRDARPACRGVALLALGVAVAGEPPVAVRLEAAAELLDQGDRAVSATGAAERDGEVALPLPPVARQGELEQVDETLQEFLRLVPLEHVVRHGRV